MGVTLSQKLTQGVLRSVIQVSAIEKPYVRGILTLLRGMVV